MSIDQFKDALAASFHLGLKSAHKQKLTRSLRLGKAEGSSIL
jgi:hypothetical protein